MSTHTDVLRHPAQPLICDPQGVVRFKENKIVSYLMASHLKSFRTIETMNFSDEDRSQLAQLIGYTVSDFGDLNSISEAEYARVVPLDKGLCRSGDNEVANCRLIAAAPDLLEALTNLIKIDLIDWDLDPEFPGDFVQLTLSHMDRESFREDIRRARLAIEKATSGV